MRPESACLTNKTPFSEEFCVPLIIIIIIIIIIVIIIIIIITLVTFVQDER